MRVLHFLRTLFKDLVCTLSYVLTEAFVFKIINKIIKVLPWHGLRIPKVLHRALNSQLALIPAVQATEQTEAMHPSHVQQQEVKLLLISLELRVKLLEGELDQMLD